MICPARAGSRAGRDFAHARVFNPGTGGVSIFQAGVLPFIAVKSVRAFLRLARAIWWLGVVGCNLMWTSFHDDYIVFRATILARSTEVTAAALFKLLGWLFAEEGRKCFPFSSSCEALGILFDLANSGKFICRLANTAVELTS